MRGGVPLAKTRIVAAPHEFGLRVFRKRVVNEGAIAQPAIHAQAVDGEGICDWIGSAGFKSHKRRHFPFFKIVPLPERRRNCDEAQHEHDQQRQAVSHGSSQGNWPSDSHSDRKTHPYFAGTKMRNEPRGVSSRCFQAFASLG